MEARTGVLSVFAGSRPGGVATAPVLEGQQNRSSIFVSVLRVKTICQLSNLLLLIKLAGEIKWV